MDNEQFQNAILRRLDVLISLSLERGDEGETPMSAKIGRLMNCGLLPREIASITGKPLNYVTANMSLAKKRRTRKAGRNA